MEDRDKRRALIEAVLPDVPFDGWSRAAVDAAARRAGIAAWSPASATGRTTGCWRRSTK
jgi:hypothetical protein